MYNNMSIKYNAKIIEVEDNIKKLETLEFDVEIYNETIKKIKNDVNSEIKECYEIYNKNDEKTFLPDSLMLIYEKSIKLLDKINSHIISEYEEYYIIDAKCKDLNNKIEKFNNFNVKEIIDETLELLNRLRKSTTTDYEKKRNIVQNVYKLVYKVIKLELVYTNNNSLLEDIKFYNSDIPYISKLIKKDIKKLEDNEKKEEILNKVQEVSTKGLGDIHLLDKNLIILLSNTDNNYSKEDKEKFLQQFKNYNRVANEIVNVRCHTEAYTDEIKKIKKYRKELLIKKFKKKTLLLLNMIALMSAITVTAKETKNNSKSNVYKTITTTYDTSSNEEETIVEYLKYTENNVTIIEYSPWEEPGHFRDYYKRNVYTYNFEDLQIFYKDIKDYLNIDINNYEIIDILTEEIEIINEPPKDNYSETKYIIKQIVQDKNDYHKVFDRGLWVLNNLFFTSIYILLDLALIYLYLYLNYNPYYDKEKLNQVLKENKIKLRKTKEILLNHKAKNDDLKKELLKLENNIKEKYYTLHTILQQDKEIKEKMLTLDK